MPSSSSLPLLFPERVTVRLPNYQTNILWVYAIPVVMVSLSVLIKVSSGAEKLTTYHALTPTLCSL
jgi:hypothetical protein